MSDDELLVRAFTSLEPTSEQVRRIEERLFAELDVLLGRELPMPTLLSEWLALLTARPVANTVLIAAAAAMLVLTSPIAALPFALFA